MTQPDYVYVCPLCATAAVAWEILVKHFDEFHSKDCFHPMVPDSSANLEKDKHE